MLTGSDGTAMRRWEASYLGRIPAKDIAHTLRVTKRGLQAILVEDEATRLTKCQEATRPIGESAQVRIRQRLQWSVNGARIRTGLRGEAVTRAPPVWPFSRKNLRTANIA